ncbi:flagellar motor switch phosphatase FliY [Clostridium septicum]|uniref:Flagellar motor switch phosphatase FliY n=1 Tax=Clostridium septicum TaxID=1504 RepID=A0A9N7PL35_CLOSE|nr:flagellar motor switch phosphatase FliY [Clostridium septicum]AYE33452.1 flagellar motor switch phosphatase FliY [Clostridium septicum]MDU1314772.1 flagellar motor switch phosphatase FliY [Clostridium septicum]QAS61623.1 flagellar motor switch phosphatase FliY [Clostridium septicum]UEC21937.1 flagellar motor switch phosphatase FliY [Clostridium septicum]USS00032.1 flagellar motor switch phosphatase FliY [Clostridium septicum]
MSNGFLSQEEIDSLLNGDSGSEKENNVEEEQLSDIEKDLLGEIGNISMGSASTALHQIINQQVHITTPKVSITTLKEIKEGFDYPTIILDVEYVTGIIGRNILIMKITDAAVIANLMMGGNGEVDSIELSDIEVSAVQEAMNQMIGSAATSMATMFAREVNISPPHSKIWRALEESISDSIDEKEEIVRVCFDLKIGELLESNIMQILPIPTAKKIVSIMMGEEIEKFNNVEAKIEDIKAEEIAESNLQQDISSSRVEEAIMSKEINVNQPTIEVNKASFVPLESKKIGEANKNIDLILDVPLNISVVLGRTKKSIKDILSLSTGSLIELDKLAEEPVEVLINGKQIAHGEVVVIDESFGVRITSIVNGVDRINSLR